MQATKGGVTLNDVRWVISYAEGLQIIWADLSQRGERVTAVDAPPRAGSNVAKFKELF
jgi:hypothetical protein